MSMSKSGNVKLLIFVLDVLLLSVFISLRWTNNRITEAGVYRLHAVLCWYVVFVVFTGVKWSLTLGVHCRWV